MGSEHGNPVVILVGVELYEFPSHTVGSELECCKKSNKIDGSVSIPPSGLGTARQKIIYTLPEIVSIPPSGLGTAMVVRFLVVAGSEVSIPPSGLGTFSFPQLPQPVRAVSIPPSGLGTLSG